MEISSTNWGGLATSCGLGHRSADMENSNNESAHNGIGRTSTDNDRTGVEPRKEQGEDPRSRVWGLQCAGFLPRQKCSMLFVSLLTTLSSFVINLTLPYLQICSRKSHGSRHRCRRLQPFCYTCTRWSHPTERHHQVPSCWRLPLITNPGTFCDIQYPNNPTLSHTVEDSCGTQYSLESYPSDFSAGRPTYCLLPHIPRKSNHPRI